MSNITLPYSVNAINGHSGSMTRGTYQFTTTIRLNTVQPTYLWFQHADQSADIYVDDVKVTTHWGGYNAFFVDISNYVHTGINNIKVALNNTLRNALAPSAGDFNFNATLGKVKVFSSPVLPSMDYGYDGFHVQATNVSSSAATLTVKTNVPVGATLICKIDDDDSNYHFFDKKPSTGSDVTFTTTISNPILWNGLANPHLYNVTLEIYKNGDLYHRYQRGYGIRFYEYVFNQSGIIENETYTGFLLNGNPYKLRGVCMHHDIENKANALTDEDVAHEFEIIQELGCNFIRLAHYPHTKEVYDWCDRLGIIVQTEVPCVNRFNSPEVSGTNCPQEYYDHLDIQYTDMVRQHFNHPCIMFWGLFNEAAAPNDSSWAKTKLEYYRDLIKDIDPERWVGYVAPQGQANPSSYMGNPDMDWYGCNIYVGWYSNNGQNSGTLSNNPTSALTTRVNNIINTKQKPLAYSEYGCGGTSICHSDDFTDTTDRGNKPRHDIEYMMWLHEGHISAIKSFPQLLFTGEWQLFDIAVSSRQEGYKVCVDGENVTENNNFKYLNNKGLLERDHTTKKDTFYLYKAWWRPNLPFVHICQKNYIKCTSRTIKCYTTEASLSLYVNGTFIETLPASDNIVVFTARNYTMGDMITVTGANSTDTMVLASTFNNIQITPGPLYYGSNGYEIKDSWNYDSYASVHGKTEGSTYFTFTEMGKLFESPSYVFNKNIENLLDPFNGWRLPTREEWSLIRGTTRAGSTVNDTVNRHYALIQLTGVTFASSSTPLGLLLFPDGQVITGTALSGMDNTTVTTGITEAQLEEYLDQGCVFLPAAGEYSGSGFQYGGTYGYYLSSTKYTYDNEPTGMVFSSSSISNFIGFGAQNYAYSIRLVRRAY